MKKLFFLLIIILATAISAIGQADPTQYNGVYQGTHIAISDDHQTVLVFDDEGEPIAGDSHTHQIVAIRHLDADQCEIRIHTPTHIITINSITNTASIGEKQSNK